MDSWVKKIALVTDCSNELGVCIIEELSRAGMITVGFAKTDDIIAATTAKLKHVTSDKIQGRIILSKCDITNIEQLKVAFEKIDANYGGVDVLINNAYCNTDCNLSSGNVKDFRELIDANIYSLVACIRLAAGYMIERKTRGHILNINDLFPYSLPEESSKNVFIATKSTTISLNEILRQEFRYLGTNIKTTNIACGLMESEAELHSENTVLKISDVAKIVTSILNTPEHLQIHEVLLDSVPE